MEELDPRAAVGVLLCSHRGDSFTHQEPFFEHLPVPEAFACVAILQDAGYITIPTDGFTASVDPEYRLGLPPVILRFSVTGATLTASGLQMLRRLQYLSNLN